MKLRVKTVVEITLDVDEASYPDGSSVRDMLELERKNYPDLLQHIINNENTKMVHALTMLDANGLPMAERYWKEGPDI